MNWLHALHGFSFVIGLAIILWLLMDAFSRISRRWGSTGVVIVLVTLLSLLVGFVTGTAGLKP